LNSPFFIGSGLYYSLETRLRYYIKANAIPRISYLLGVLAHTYYVSLQVDIFETAFASIFHLMASSKDLSHPQFISLLMEYYLKGGKLSLQSHFPQLSQALPRVDVDSTEVYGSTMKQLLPLEAMVKIEEQPFAVTYLHFANSFEQQSLGSLLLFKAAINPNQFSIPSFEFFLEKRYKLVSSLAIKCYNLPTLFRFIGSQRLNAKKANEKIKKLEVAHRLLLEMLDGIEVEVDNTRANQESKTKQDHGSSDMGLKADIFQTRLTTLERNDYCESFVLLQILLALSKSGVGEIYVSSMISVVLNAAVKELWLFTEGRAPLHVQTVAVLYKVTGLTKLTNLQEDVVRIAFAIRKYPNELERIMHWKLLTSILVKQPATQADTLIFDKFCKTLFYSKDHLADSRDAMKNAWEKFDLLCKTLSMQLPLDDILSSFDGTSLFHSKNHFTRLEQRFISHAQENTFLKDILVITENPIVDLMNKLSNHLAEKGFLKIGIFNKSIIIMMQSALRRSLSTFSPNKITSTRLRNCFRQNFIKRMNCFTRTKSRNSLN
jgi:hypothetical protein